MKQQSENSPHKVGQRGKEPPQAGKNAVPPLPTIGPPLDGRQYRNIVEEQIYSEQRPTAAEQQPRRAKLQP